MPIHRSDIEREIGDAQDLVALFLARGQSPPLYVILVLFGAQALLHGRPRRRHRTVRLGLSIVPVEKRRHPMDGPVLIDGSTQDALCQCSPVDAAGNPTTPTVTWESSDDTGLRLDVAADTRSARGVALKDGTYTITCHTGSLAEGTPVISESGTVVVSGIGSGPAPTAALGLNITATPKQV